MKEERFIVKFISVKNCFVYIPNNWLQRLSAQVISSISFVVIDQTVIVCYVNFRMVLLN